MVDVIRDFYSDGIPHSNQELYDYFNDLLGDVDIKRNHIIRGEQQHLKQNGEIVNVGYGIWQAA